MVLAPKDVVDDQVVHPLKEVLRVATKDDDEREKYNRSVKGRFQDLPEEDSRAWT